MTRAEDRAFATLTDRIAREEIAPRVDDSIVTEHEANPFGPHSDDLQRVLTFLRRRPASGARVVVVDDFEEWRIARLPASPCGQPALLEERYDSQAAAIHALFLDRLAEFRERYDLDPADRTGEGVDRA